ncbi:MAG TPA: FHA domain-containing protein [Gemmataceae bacterium]|nr:FHA domain-containing protein [Gemmataceae bacterium]
MEPTDLVLPVSPADHVPPSAGELIIQNGRLSGTRRPLVVPLTLIGRADGCDLRLNVEGVHPFHCVLALGPSGLHLRDLQGDGSTLVNGEPALDRLLHDGDLLSVGPFRFRVQLPEEPAVQNAEALEKEKESLRIQAAAVAAQQAVLMHEEMELQQHRSALQQQEQQLAAHLEDKRQRLVALRNDAQRARAALEQERAAYEERVAQVLRELAHSRVEIKDQQSVLLVQRRRLSGLRRRLKRRWHRHWSVERAAMCRRETEIHELERQLEEEALELRQVKAQQEQARLHFNGEFELKQRQQQAAWDELRGTQAELQEQARLLGQREAELLEGERNLAKEKRVWNATRLRLNKEVEGLEKRVHSYRRKIIDQEQEVLGLEILRRDVQSRQSNDAVCLSQAAENGSSQGHTIAEAAGSNEAQAREQLREAEAALQCRLAALEDLSAELADQRLYLAEECERLAQGQLRWQQERTATVAGLEALGLELQEREQSVCTRERSVERAEFAVQQQSAQVAQARTHLEALKARVAAGALAWEGERAGLLLDVRTREEVMEQRLAALTTLRERWDKRRQHQVTELRTQRRMYQELRRECANLREKWLQRSALQLGEQRAVAERALAMEQYRQEWISKAANPKAAEKRLERLRRRWTALSALATRSLAVERRRLEVEAKHLEDQILHLEQSREEVVAQHTELSSRQAAWEEEQIASEAEESRLKQEVMSLRDQRSQQEQVLKELRDQIERLARLLLEGDDPGSVPSVQAA